MSQGICKLSYSAIPQCTQPLKQYALSFEPTKEIIQGILAMKLQASRRNDNRKETQDKARPDSMMR